MAAISSRLDGIAACVRLQVGRHRGVRLQFERHRGVRLQVGRHRGVRLQVGRHRGVLLQAAWHRGVRLQVGRHRGVRRQAGRHCGVAAWQAVRHRGVSGVRGRRRVNGLNIRSTGALRRVRHSSSGGRLRRWARWWALSPRGSRARLRGGHRRVRRALRPYGVVRNADLSSF